MGVQANPYPLRVDRELLDKFRVVAKENGRSINKEIEAMMKRAVTAHEKANGPIILPADPS